jgi:nicotinate-nucleotide adenylyltransferase
MAERATSRRRRIALFGGTFDPVHRGHLAIARAAANAFVLDCVLFAPAGLQPLKATHVSSSFADRTAMVELACEADARFRFSDVDAPRPDGEPNYTVDALAAVAANPGVTLFNLVGADSFRDLGKWHHPAELLQLAEWIVVSRPGYTLADPRNYPLTPAQRERVHLLNAVHLDVSATALRDRLGAGELCDDLLTAPVAAYIQSHGLYRGA